MELWNKFVEEVTVEFRFLEEEFGFVQKTAASPFVNYESDKIQVSIYYDVNRHCELDLRIRRLDPNIRNSFSKGIGMLIALKEESNSEGYMSPFPSTEEALEKEVKRLAHLLRKYGSELLAGDLTCFQRLEEQEKEIAKKFGPKSTFINRLKRFRL